MSHKPDGAQYWDDIHRGQVRQVGRSHTNQRQTKRYTDSDDNTVDKTTTQEVNDYMKYPERLLFEHTDAPGDSERLTTLLLAGWEPYAACPMTGHVRLRRSGSFRVDVEAQKVTLLGHTVATWVLKAIPEVQVGCTLLGITPSRVHGHITYTALEDVKWCQATAIYHARLGLSIALHLHL